MVHGDGPGDDLYHQYFERTGDAFLVIEGDRFVACNEATVRLLRYGTREELLQVHPAALSPEFQSDGRPSREKADEMMAIARERGSHRFEWDHRRADGEVFPVEVLLTAVPRGDRVMLHVVWRDLTDRRRLESDLQQAQKMEALGRLSAGIAHDFNNLLVAINGHAELLVGDLADRPEEQSCAEEILRAGSRAADLVAQLLAFSRRQVLRPRTVDLGDVLAEMAGMVRRLAGEAVVTEVEADDRPLWVTVDPGQVSQVVLNLAANARDAMGGRGNFRLRAARVIVDAATPGLRDELPPGNYVCLTAVDDGTGIAASDLPHVFEPFFTTKAAGRGTGLGLATVYGIVRQSGGSIGVTSNDGAGTCFAIYLPEAAAPAADDEPPAEAPVAPLKPASILLVEDEDATGRLVRMMLERAGFAVKVAAGGEEALALLGAPAPGYDLLLSDIVMPGIDGIELVNLARAAGCTLPVLMTSGYPAEFLAQRGDLPAGIDLIQKPFSAHDLVRRVREALERS